ncbi:Wadjet anti-phage system protein JetD domain-containing protein [Bradyrhizobium sp. dw_411]|uniref:Wadjet anti-phage system protein JetD domain-containing protein n=1 Tax=Bradyrhizobium sp. dw_411 TaxID=2720082 RepID=UPI001BCE5246|nr:Wadjet anti-phage system protein JetD domain-containing protein [Bradyrhizobium sp. dw_411]
MTVAGGEAARKVLVRLLESADRNATATRTLSVAAGAPKDPSPAVQRTWRERLEGAERTGAVALVRGAGNRRDVIERVHLLDADRLALDLGITRAGTRTAAAVTAAREATAGREGLDPAIEDAAGNWSRGAEWYRLPAEPELVRNVFGAAAGLLEVAFGTHFRVASAQAAGSSKFLERNAAAICAILRRALALPEDARQHEIWETLGLVRFGHPVCLRAPVGFEDRDGTAVTGYALPWSAVNPDLVETCTAIGSSPTFIMTVENWTSFNGQCREIHRGAVVYTHGFPPPPVRMLVGRLAALWPNAPFYHWGDVDAGGLLIADSIREAAGRAVRLHLMTASLAERHGAKSRPLSRVAGIAARDDDFGELARYLSGDCCRTFEQEMLRPMDPLELVP